MERCIFPINGRTYNQGAIMHSHLTPLDFKKAKFKMVILPKISRTLMRTQTKLLDKMDRAWTVGLCVNVCSISKGRYIKPLSYILLIRSFVGSALSKSKQSPGTVGARFCWHMQIKQSRQWSVYRFSLSLPPQIADIHHLNSKEFWDATFQVQYFGNHA